MPEDFRYAGSLDRPIYSLHFVDIILTFGLIHFVPDKTGEMAAWEANRNGNLWRLPSIYTLL